MDESKTFCFVCVGEGKISFPSNLLGSLWLGPWLAKDRLTKGKHTSLFNFLMKPPMSCKAHVLGDTGSFIRIWRHKWSEVAQSCPTLCDPMDCSLIGSFVHGIFQARMLEWVAFSFSRRSFRPRDWTRVSLIVGRRFTIWATREILMRLTSRQLLKFKLCRFCLDLRWIDV